ncbi:hypothetical protein BASA50_006098 [Batrachochytrium salamandrivorans]|uniref:CRAL-TRIO domain-containing protein n=1 Tax=Batrachochytrium salamandrivorans TaxID=1357716 RepID=A0ABQ8FAW5_9FUNG|nr:hypothetical protein BASA60_010883 [Batrachochytrium salamandrivorans]KAH6580133.1 hypothetical protein BASA61_009824 [Batrachochytrium salamandrivorans]KAH6595112.1 hypothetical protein BASA50_006098 [Batrachochytrium salamandrivorans]KAH9274344.1 hypothetical protein BASA83_003342 [Batrachochytrium salamandrivorans]
MSFIHHELLLLLQSQPDTGHTIFIHMTHPQWLPSVFVRTVRTLVHHYTDTTLLAIAQSPQTLRQGQLPSTEELYPMSVAASQSSAETDINLSSVIFPEQHVHLRYTPTAAALAILLASLPDWQSIPDSFDSSQSLPPTCIWIADLDGICHGSAALMTYITALAQDAVVRISRFLHQPCRLIMAVAAQTPAVCPPPPWMRRMAKHLTLAELETCVVAEQKLSCPDLIPLSEI